MPSHIEFIDGDEKPTFLAPAAESILYPFLLRDIIICVPHGRTRSLPDGEDERFHIFIWSTFERPDADNDARPPQNVFGIPVCCRDLAYKSSGKGVSITDPATGYAAAELFKNCLFIHHDICHTEREEEIRLFSEILRRASSLWIKNFYSFPKSSSAEAGDLLAFLREAGFSSYTKRLDGLALGLEERERKIRNWQGQIITAAREASVMQGELQVLRQIESDLTPRLARETEAIAAHPKIESVHLLGGEGRETLLLVTKELEGEVRSRGRIKKGPIGRFEILFFPAGWEDAERGLCFFLFRLFDGARKVPTAAFSEGVLSSPAVKEAMTQLIGRGDFATLISMAIDLLESSDLSQVAV